MRDLHTGMTSGPITPIEIPEQKIYFVYIVYEVDNLIFRGKTF